MTALRVHSVKAKLDVPQVHGDVWEVFNFPVIGKILIGFFFSCLTLSLCFLELIVCSIFVKITLAFAGQEQRFYFKSQFENLKFITCFV